MRRLPRDKNYLMAVGLAIRDLRTAAGFSQEGLAEKADLHRTYIGSVERGEKNVTVLSLLHIAKALKTTPAGILSKAELLLRKNA